MKHIRPTMQLVAALVAGILSAQSTYAALDTWNATADGNWSVNGNWDQGFAPGSADDARFFNVGGNTVNTVDVSTTINSLVYAQDNQLLQTTTISPGQTLTVSRSGAGDVLNVGSTGGATTASTQTPVSITGSGGTLNLSGSGDIVIKQGNSANGSHMATLDLSGLDNFNATVGRLLVGQGTGTAINRPSGTLILAKTNHITLTGASPQVMIQDGGQNANNIASVLTFGQDTHLYGDVMRLGGQKGNANLNFNPAFSLPSLQIRNADGVSPVSIIDFGYNGAVSSGNNTILVADFSAGTVDLSANLVNIAQGNPGNPGTGNCTGTVTLGAGTLNVNDLEIGWGNATAGNNGPATGTLNVNNNFLFSTGAVVVANTMLRLARTNGGNGVINGTLNLNGGTVMANTIVSGGGVSTINVNSGSTLVVSNTAGTLAFPIRTFTISDATLTIPASSGGAAVFAKNFSAGGSQNTINVSAIPPIGAYPATLPLISYQSGSGGNFVLGPLPAGSPAYSGTLVDNGDGVISLSLTAGPIADVTETWTGAAGSSWDTSSYSWLFHSAATNFFNSAVVIFDDTATVSDVYLAESLSPGSVTVNNSSLNYSFSGPGHIAGASALIKSGTGGLVIANSDVDNFVTMSINGGTLQVGTGDVDGSISALNITNNGSLVVNRSGTLALGSAISGTGTLTKNGDGTLILSGANSYSGATILNAGTLEIDGISSGAGTMATSAGTVLAGNGTVNGAVTVGGQMNPGSSSSTGIFNANGGLTLNSGSTLQFDLSAADPGNPAVNDSINVAGNLDVNNNTITVNIAGTPQGGASYLLFTYTGNLSGSFNPVIVGTHYAVNLDTSNHGYVYLTITGGSGADLDWASVSDPLWNASATNWLDLNTLAPSFFSAGDSALLDDTPGVVTGITIDSGVTVYPSVITNNSTNNYFSISGAGHIGGSASIVKSGISVLTINTANTFTGPVDIQSGFLQVGNGTALGTTASGTTIEDGGTLDLNGQNLGGEVITVSGSGYAGAGAIVNNAGAQFQALRQVVLAGDTTFGGTGTWQINNGGGTASLSTSGNPFKLTKTGVNQVSLAQVAAIDPALGDIDIQQGILEFSGLTPNMGDPSATNTVEAGATLSFANGTVAWFKQFVFNGDGVTTTVNIGSGANTELAGPIELNGNCVFNVGGTLLTISGPISGPGGVIKTGGSPMIFTAASTYTGDTRLNSAALRLNDAADISSSPNIIISAGSTLTVTGLVNSAFTLVSGQTLKGNGVVSGKLIASDGSIVAPGLDAVGVLTVSNTITLLGTSIMELDPANGTNDVLKSGLATITYGGTLNLVNLGDTLTNGSSFKLFSALNYLGSFANISPATPGPGQTWDISALNTSGTIKVVTTAPPTFGGIKIMGTNVVFSGSNGVASSPYYVLTSTNVASPRISWTPIATNMFDANGNFIFTNSVNSTLHQQFFQIQLP